MKIQYKKTTAEFKNFENAEYISLSFETKSVVNKRVDLFSIASPSPGGGYIYAVFTPDKVENLLLFLKGRKVVFHDWVFAGQVLLLYGFDIFSFDPECTMLMSVIVDENRPSILTNRCLEDLNFKILRREGVDKNYIEDEAVGIIALYDYYKQKIIEEELVLAYKTELKSSYSVLFMERNGLGYDPAQGEKLKSLCKKLMQETEDRIFLQAGYIFDLAGKKQLAYFIYRDLGIVCRREWRTRKTGEPSTSKRTLQKIIISLPGNDKRISILTDLISWATLHKLYTSFFDIISEAADRSVDGRIHANINQAVVVTGRLSISNPPLHELPRNPLKKDDLLTHIRSSFIPSPGNCFVAADYSEVELRILAHCSGDLKMIRAYEKGVSNHLLVAEGLKISRQQAKIVNFGLLNKMTIPTLAFQLKTSEQEAEKFMNQYYKLFPGIIWLREQIVQHVKTQGYVRLLNGRKRRLSPKLSQRDIESVGGSGVIQGGGGILIKMAMIKLLNRYKKRPEIKQVLQMHDELVFECPIEIKKEVAQGVQEEMEKALELKVPLVVKSKIGMNLAQCK